LFLYSLRTLLVCVHIPKESDTIIHAYAIPNASSLASNLKSVSRWIDRKRYSGWSWKPATATVTCFLAKSPQSMTNTLCTDTCPWSDVHVHSGRSDRPVGPAGMDVDAGDVPADPRVMELDDGDAPSDPGALRTSVERMTGAAATGIATEPMMAQEIYLLSLIQNDSLVSEQSWGLPGGPDFSLRSHSVSSAGSSGSGQSSFSTASWWSHGANSSGSEPPSSPRAEDDAMNLPDDWSGESDVDEFDSDEQDWASLQDASDDEDPITSDEKMPASASARHVAPMVSEKSKGRSWYKGGHPHINSQRVFGKLHPIHRVLTAAVTKEELVFLTTARAVATATVSHKASLFSLLRVGSVQAMYRPPDD